MKQQSLFPPIKGDPELKLQALMVMREMVHASRESLISAQLALLESGVHRFNVEIAEAVESLDNVHTATLELSMKLLAENMNNVES